MAGELKTSQFRFTTTADDDFVIGNPGNVAAHTTKALVFQTTQIPGYGANPSFSCVWNGTSWEFNLDKADGSGAIPLTGMAYVAANNAFTGNNTFAGTSTFTGTSTFRGYTRIANPAGTILTTLLPGTATASVTLPSINGTLVLTNDSHLLPNYTTANNNQVLTVVTGIPVWRAESGLGGNTTVSLSSTGTLVTAGSSYVVTATLTSSETAAYTGSTVIFTDNGIVVATVGVVGNTATYSVASAGPPGGGTHSYKATFSGDFVHTPCVSTALLVTVGISSVTPTMSLVRTGGSGTGTDNVGTSLTFTITVSGSSGIPTGTVIFYDGTTPISGAQTLAGGISSITTSALTAGTHLISATYTPSGTVYSITSSAAISQTILAVGAVGSTTTLTRTVGTSSEPFGTNITFHVVVTKTGGGGVTPTGTIIFKDGATIISTGTLTLTSGALDWSISSLAVASHSITAVYSGDSAYTTSVSNVMTQAITAPVGGSTPTVTMSVGAGGGTDNTGSLNLSATVVGTGYSTNPPLGLITWYQVTGPADPTILLMLASIETVVQDPGDGLQDVYSTANHLYTFSVGSVTPGTAYYLMATYSDYDTYYDTTNSAIYTEHIVTAPALVTSSIYFNSLAPGDPAYVAAGSTVNIHASVTGNYAQPTGTVTFHAQRYNLDSTTWTDLGDIGTAVPIVGSVASTTYSCPTADYIYITGIYHGDGVYTAGPYYITQVPIFFQELPNIAVTVNNNPASPSSVVTYTITMSSSTSSTQWHPATMGGYVNLNISGGSLGTYSTMGYLNSSGIATFSKNVGTLNSSIYASWWPTNGTNDIFTGLNSTPLTQIVGGGGGGGITTHTYLTRNGSSSAGPITDSQHTALTFEAIVDNSAATGSVVFMNNGITPLHTTTPLIGGVATWGPTPWDTAGTYVVTAVYSGDSTYNGSTSTAITEIISAGSGGSFYRPSTYTNGYVYGTTDGGTLNEVNVWDFDTVPTLDTTTAAYVFANNGTSSRKYEITYSGFGTGTVSGSIYAYISASATGWIEGAYAVAAPQARMLIEYSTNAGSTWTTIIAVENSGIDRTTPGTEIGPINSSALSSIALADLRVRVSCTGATSGSAHTDTLAHCASDCYVYDIVLK